jgi:hypothetical protein
MEVNTKQFSSDSNIVYLDDPYEIIDKPLSWQTKGLQQTATGYGSKLTSTRCVKFPDGKTRRIYITCYGNAGSAWITVNGKKVYLLG